MDKKPKNPYVKRGFLSRLPMWFKALFIKFWFAGATFYFIGWGFAARDVLDLIFVLGMVHGLVTDILTNKVIIFIEIEPGQNAKYMLAHSKKFVSLLVNLLFGLATAAAVAYTYNTVNILAVRAGIMAEGFLLFGAEPISYGLLYLLYDMIFVTIKNTLLKIYRSAKDS